MKKRILLVDESLTVQKVVALTLDKGRYEIIYARTRQEVIKSVLDEIPHLILLSDAVQELPWQSFPKELEAWLGRNVSPPPVLLITNQEIREAKHYAACLKKPFTPQNLQAAVEAQFAAGDDSDPLERTDTRGFVSNPELNRSGASADEDRLERAFNSTFSNEENLVNETLGSAQQHQSHDEGYDEVSYTQTVFDARSPKNRNAAARKTEGTNPTAASLWEDSSASAMTTRAKPAKPEGPEELWGTNAMPVQNRGEDASAHPQVMSADDSMAYKSVLENEVQSRLEKQDLEEIVTRTLNKLMPPIVEKLVQERLDHLLREHEESLSP